METREIIQFCLEGNKEAENRLFMRYANRVYTICLRYCKQKEEAKDLMQECFITLFDNLSKYDENKGEFEGWMFRVCTNVVLKKLRKKKHTINISYPEYLPEKPEEAFEEALEHVSNQTLLETIQALPEGYRQVLNLYVFEGLKHTEIGDCLGISAATSRSQYGRAKKLLKANLEKKIANKINNEERRLA